MGCSVILKPSIQSLLIRVSNILLGVAVAVALAKLLGPSGYGEYALIISLITFLTIPAKFGVPQFIVRETSSLLAQGHLQAISSLWSATNVLSVAFSLIFAAVFVAFSGIFMKALEVDSSIILAAFLIPLGVLADLQSSKIRGLGRVASGQLPESVIRPLVFLCMIICCFYFGLMVSNPVGYSVGLQVIAATLSLLFASVLLRRNANTVPRYSPPGEKSYRDIMSSIGLLSMATAAGKLNAHVDILALGLFLNTESVGVYKIAALVATLGLIAYQAVSVVLMPKVAALVRSERPDELQSIVVAGTRLAIVPVLVFSGFLAFFGEHLLEMTFGPEYAGAYLPSMILVASYCIRSFAGPSQLVLTMSGKEKFVAVTSIVSLLTNVTLNWILILRYGLVGAALATSIVNVLTSCIMYAAVVRHHGIDTSIFGLDLRDKF